jgi:hypothetical protein
VGELALDTCVRGSINFDEKLASVAISVPFIDGRRNVAPRELSSWDELDLEDLLSAFRKAKADCFFERSVYVAEQFSQYENDLFENLKLLLRRLRKGEVDSVLREAQRKPGVFAKGITFERREPGASSAHAFFSDADRAFNRLKADNHIVPEFRLVGNFAVEMHILSGL